MHTNDVKRTISSVPKGLARSSDWGGTLGSPAIISANILRSVPVGLN